MMQGLKIRINMNNEHVFWDVTLCILVVNILEEPATPIFGIEDEGRRITVYQTT
jgi:hypothetical protein